ncbi:hypothetical protein PGTUg99_025472 [Puccinia graminis f. sp. tritici]|uniref:Uncharacterized protein n=1 Tax=Puccinia graminis f. sp. tritici TaxID=56615 RepID=A0A5B0N243_PUCGR|nr:hypothetical protein PGTUg99_025472 [Puccinia graminis f. sp. tritici]
MSREVYAQLRLIISLTGCHLPHWSTIRASRQQIRKMLNLELKQRTSVFENKCYSVSVASLLRQELSNPYVHPHLDFYPEECHGLDIYKTSQCSKWLKGLAPDLRVQMATNKDKHFYVFEPAQLISGEIVVPVFFYTEASEVYAKCAFPQMVAIPGQSTMMLQIPAELAFDSANLVPIKLALFDLIYSEIDLGSDGMLSMVCSNKLWETGTTSTAHDLPNPWHTRADGKVIRHMPINMFADDTSGNVSKQWNKHLSYYCTLSGLPPKLSNMQYNCHFLSTSNEAGVLELAEPIVEELNLGSTQGFPAYDPGLNADVLVMTVVLSFQADSPMHAEVTNTTVPGVCLNPCRMCDLHLDCLNDKRSRDYVQKFVHIDQHGNDCPVSSRSWSDVQNRTGDLWETAQDGVKCHFDDKSKEKGIRDTLNRTFVEMLQDKEHPDVQAECESLAKQDLERLFNPFLKLRDTPVEILHVFLLGVVKYMTRDFLKSLKPPQLKRVMASWNSFNIKSLNITSIQSKYWMSHYKSLVGKDFKIILQTAPFVLYEFMDNRQRRMWSALCTLSTYIFETQIPNMTNYLIDLRKHIKIFLWHALNSSAQWVNKPKLHMLIHLPESIERFGPASLFSTENFESYNSLLRTASVHSNRHQPGRDVAVTFLNYQMLRLILSNARLFNWKTSTPFHVSDQITHIFSHNPLIQKSMGYNPEHVSDSNRFPLVMQTPLRKEDLQATPTYFDSFPNSNPIQIASLRLSEKDILQKDFFVLVVPGGHSTNQILGRVESLWQCSHTHGHQYVVKVTMFHKKGTHSFYQMRILENGHTTAFCFVSDIKACLNVQHDCFTGKCRMDKSTINNTTTESCPSQNIIIHSDDQQFILNSASLAAPKSHRQLASLNIAPIQPSSWQTAITHGMKVWAAGLKTQQARKEAAAGKNKIAIKL